MIQNPRWPPATGGHLDNWFPDDNSVTVWRIALKLHRVVGLDLGKKPIEIDNGPKSKMAASHRGHLENWFPDDNSVTICRITLKFHRVVGLCLGKKPIEIDDDPKSKMATSHRRPSLKLLSR
jgi:hypothetical protein